MEDISKIIGSLSDDDIGKLKSLATDLFGESTEEKPQQKPQQNNVSQLPIDPDMVKRVTKIIGMLKEGAGEDPKENFIQSLKPLLSDKRQEKADEAIKMMHLFDMLPVLKESGLLQF